MDDCTCGNLKISRHVSVDQCKIGFYCKPVDRAAFLRVADSLRARGCERLVLGCTELSLLKKEGLDDELFVDSLDVLAYRTILACGKTPVGFPASFAKECR